MKTNFNEAVIVAYGRSAIARAFKGSLNITRPEDYAAEVVRGVLSKIPELDPSLIDDIIMGCAFPEAEQGFNVARIISMRAGLPNSVSAQTVNRFCSSGLQSIALAANSIIAGQAEIVLAGGVESMTMVPMTGNVYSPNPYLLENYPEAYMSMGLTAENVASKYGISREEQDAFAVESHRKSAIAQEEGKFDDEIIPFEVIRQIQNEAGDPLQEKILFNKDEGIRKTTSLQSLAKLKTVFKENGTVTPGNASQMSDGAAVVVLMSRSKAQDLGLKPIAVFRSFAVAGVDPDYMGLGPIYAIPKALKIADLGLDEIDLIELNEAFASQSIACINDLKLNIDKVNVNGGAISLGHPLGCSGAALTIKLLSEMKRRNSKYGLVSMCIGGGMGAAGIFELVTE